MLRRIDGTGVEAPNEVRPGRSCPLHYRYGAASLCRAAEMGADTLYVIGGLYGNPYALDRVGELAAAERGPTTLVFNGDFNWFNLGAGDFRQINTQVLRHTALRGNVETELFAESADAGCGCGYPDWVGHAEVDRSNQIMSMLRQTARGAVDLAVSLSRLPMTLVAEVGGLRIGIVHGDADALAGWNFSQEVMCDQPGDAAGAFERADVDVFASSHTCLPVARRIESRRGSGLLFNNGAAGMPNFSGTRFGLATRISIHPAQGALYGAVSGRVHVDAIPIHYDHAAWLRHFDRSWPAESAAALSYRGRIVDGPGYDFAQAQQLSAVAGAAGVAARADTAGPDTAGRDAVGRDAATGFSA